MAFECLIGLSVPAVEVQASSPAITIGARKCWRVACHVPIELRVKGVFPRGRQQLRAESASRGEQNRGPAHTKNDSDERPAGAAKATGAHVARCPREKLAHRQKARAKRICHSTQPFTRVRTAGNRPQHLPDLYPGAYLQMQSAEGSLLVWDSEGVRCQPINVLPVPLPFSEGSLRGGGSVRPRHAVSLRYFRSRDRCGKRGR
jgi:hypothetical protein